MKRALEKGIGSKLDVQTLFGLKKTLSLIVYYPVFLSVVTLYNDTVVIVSSTGTS